MIDQKFFSKKREFFTLQEVLEVTNSRILTQDIDLNSKILGASTLKDAKTNYISFFHSNKYLTEFLQSQASFCFMEEKYATKAPKTMLPLISDNPYFSYAIFLNEFYFDKKINQNNKSQEEFISNQAFISKNAKIGEGTIIKAGAYIGNNVTIGKNCQIDAGTVIEDNCQIGDETIIHSLAVISYCNIGNNCIIHNGVKIGQDGFGFAYHQGRLQKVLQLGIVEIADDVEIGSNSCIDRGAINNTKIGRQVKIDNLVQIAHNVVIGEGTVIAGCAAIAGSSIIGKFVQIGGSANVAGHLKVGDGAKIAGGSGVIKDVLPLSSVGGLPAISIKDWHRISLKLMQLIKKSN